MIRKRVLLLGLGLWVPLAAVAQTPSEILLKADEIRNPAQSFQMMVEVSSSGSAQETSRFEVALKGNTRTLIRTLAPSRDKGRKLLMVEQDMWAFLPSVSRPIRVSLAQRLTGQASNGDLSRLRWAGDYDAKVEREDAKSWTLFLTARRKGLTYEKIRAWIEKGTFKPIRAEYLSVSGMVMKRARYGGWRDMAGRERPTEIEIQDAIREQDRSTIRILSMQAKNFPDSQFNPQGLK